MRSRKEATVSYVHTRSLYCSMQDTCPALPRNADYVHTLVSTSFSGLALFFCPIYWCVGVRARVSACHTTHVRTHAHADTETHIRAQYPYARGLPILADE